MSAGGNDYPFLKKSVMQHFNNQQPAESSTQSTTGMSDKIKSGRFPITPQTMYDGDDELSEIPGSDKAVTHENSFASQASHVSDEASHSMNAPEPISIQDNDDSNDEDAQGQQAPSPPSSADDNIQAPGLVYDPICAGETDGRCTLRSGDHRKVVSHIFGRNKRCTHQIPEECWIKYCRKHYQRQKYRRPSDWPDTQLTLVDEQLEKMEQWGGISSWTVAIRKKERVALDAENAYLAQHGRLPDSKTCRERFLLPYLGSGKTFAEIRNLINIVNQECDDHKGEENWKDLPSFELLPEIDERRNPRPRRGATRRIIGHAHVRGSVPSTFRLSVGPEGRITQTPAVSTARSASGPAASTAASRQPTHVSGAYAPVAKPEKTEEKIEEKTEEKTEMESPNPLKRSSSDTESDTDSINAEILRVPKRSCLTRAQSV
ncbi:MAG: hypothetical protein Q9218_007443 [Villophora microphyllina]